MNFRTLPLFDSSSVTVCNPPSRTLFQSSGGRASLGLFPCSRHAGPPSHQGVRRREGELEVERVCRAGWAPPPPPPPPPPPFMSWTLEPLPSRSWGKPLNTRAFSPPGGPRSPAFHTSATNEVSKLSEQGEGSLTSTRERLSCGETAAPVGQITSDIKTTEQCAVVWLRGWKRREKAQLAQKKRSVWPKNKMIDAAFFRGVQYDVRCDQCGVYGLW